MVGPFLRELFIGCLGGSSCSSRGPEATAAWALAGLDDQCLHTSDHAQAPSSSCCPRVPLHQGARPHECDASSPNVIITVELDDGTVDIGGPLSSLENLLDNCWVLPVAHVGNHPNHRWTACLDRLHQVSGDGGGRSGVGKDRLWRTVLGPQMRGNHARPFGHAHAHA